MYISNSTSGKALGLFSFVGNSNITDLGITGNISTNQAANTGGILGNIKNNTICNINNCYNKATISSSWQGYSIGGLVGSTESGTLKVNNCYNQGIISGSNNAGGLVELTMNSVDIESCYNTGEITNNLGNHAGGLIGRDNATTNSITISNSYNKGTVTGTFSVGGILGRSYGTTDISNTHNAGNVTSTVENVSSAVNIGGIVGSSSKTINVTNCYNIADVTSNATYVTSVEINNGGIIGKIYNGIIEKCYNTGKITNGNRVAGIVGISTASQSNVSNSKIIDSFNTGEVDATFLDNNKVENTSVTGRAAGISEQTWYNNLKILNCYNRGNIKSYLKPAGIIRANPNSNLVILNCYNIGNLNNNDGFGIIDSAKATDSISNVYYLNNVSTGVNGITPDPANQMTEAQMKEASFITTLNNNKNNINLADYGLTGHTLSSWKAGPDGYPVFDW